VSYWQKFENNIQPILDLNIPVILGGDLNIDMLGHQCGHFEDILTRLNLENVVWEPTRITHTSATCIDLFITNRPFYFQREYSNSCLPFHGLWNYNQPDHIF
jgi:hypothetical protein